MFGKNLLIIILAMVLSACTLVKNVKIRSVFNPDQVAWIKKRGNNTIKGSALIRQAGGVVVTCAGNEVMATPYSEYANERIFAIYKSNTKGYRKRIGFPRLDKPHPLYSSMTKKTICDVQGYFSFNNLPDGQYFVTAFVLWTADGYFYQGGALMEKVKVSGGETKEIVLAP